MKPKKAKVTFLIVSIVIMLLVGIGTGWNVSMASVGDDVERDPAFRITNYETVMVVNEDNTINIDETITTKFSMPGKHGIFRNIPLVNTLDVENNGKTKTITQSIKIYDIKGNQNSQYSEEDGNIVISEDEIVIIKTFVDEGDNN